MPPLIDALRGEHQTVTALLDALDRQAAILEAAGEPDCEVLAALAEYFSDFPVQVHHPKETLIWAALMARDPAAGAPIGDLEAEHRRLAELTRGFVAAIDAVLHDVEVPRVAAARTIRRFVAAERQHMAEEEDIFFPAALRALRAEDWATLATIADARTDPMVDAADRRFAALRRTIAEAAPRPAAR
jgi:hemerythrin-like domain-containing protein